MASKSGRGPRAHVSRIDFVDIIFKALDYSVDGIAIGSVDGTIYYCNKTWLEIHGWKTGTNVRGKRIQDIERDALKPLLKKVFRGLKTVGHYEEQFGITRPDGYYHDLSLSVRLLRDFDPPIVVALMREVTDIVSAKRILERRNRELAVLDEISRVITDAPDRATLARGMLLKLCDFVGAKAGGVYEVDRAKEFVELIEAVGIPRRLRPLVQHVPTRGPVYSGILVAKGVTVVEEDMPARRRSRWDIRTSMGFGRTIGFMFRTGGKRDYLVILGLASTENVSPDVRRLLEMIAVRFGLALDRVELREKVAARGRELEQRAAELEVFAKLHNAMISSDKSSVVIRNMLVIIRRFVKAKGIALFRVEPKSAYATLYDSVGHTQREMRAVGRVPLKGSALGAIAQSKHVYVIEEEQPRYHGGARDIRKKVGVHMTVGFRFPSGGKTDFIIVLGFRYKKEVTPEHRRFLEMVGRHFAIAVERVDIIATLRERERDLEALTDRLITTAEDERSGCARMLHDELGQALTMLRLDLDMCERKYHGTVPVATTSAPFEEIRDRIRQIADQSRMIGKHLHPSTLESLGLIETLRDYADRVAKGKVRRFEIEGIGFDEELPNRISRALYYIGVEAVTNIVKHSKATRAKITVTRGFPHAIMRIADNGIGISARGGKKTQHGLGLISMRERAELLGGSFQLRSSPGKGVQIRIRIPIEARHARKA